MTREEKVRKSIDDTAIMNLGIYGSKALMDVSLLNQKPDVIMRPDYKTPRIKAPIITPDISAFDKATQEVRSQTAAARRGISEAGTPEYIPSILAGAYSAIEKIGVDRSTYLNSVNNQNAIAEAEAGNKQSLVNAEIANKAESDRIQMQMQENNLVSQANSSALASLQTTMAQIGTIGAQRSQSIVDLMYLDDLLSGKA